MEILLDYTEEEIKSKFVELGLKKFRAKQVYEWLTTYEEFDNMSNISKEDRELLAKNFIARPVTIMDVKKGDEGTMKFLFNLVTTGDLIEGVLLKYKYGYTVCVSTQVGCRMGCKFCASTLNGLKRNLSAGEILLQILFFNKLLGGTLKERKVTNVVLMGCGEPLDNYDNVAKFLKLVSSEDGLNISQRNISLSTCGIVPNIYKLADDGFTVTLTISLHAPNDELRKKTMPIANVYTIEEILKACDYYFDKTGRRIAFEYALVDGLNDTDEAIEQLARVLKGRSCHVNLIPLNSVKERKLIGTNRKKGYQIAGKLEKLGISATVRRTMGEDIEGACGQLRNRVGEQNG